MGQIADRMENLSGSIIREILKMTQVADIISFGGGFPAPESFPAQEIAAITADILAEKGQEVLQYGVTEGYLPLREQIIARMAKKGIKATLDNTLILSGAQQGIDLLCKTFLNKGDYIVMEDPTFLGAVQTMNTYEAQLLPVPMDEQGMDAVKLEEVLKKYNPKLIYTIPNFQNPTGVTMTKARRQQVVELATKYNAVIIEDDPYGELRYSGEVLPALKTFDNKGVVVYLGSFSKVIAPGLRVGWAIAEPDIMRKMAIGKQATDVHTSNLSQQIVYQYLQQNLLDKHIAEIIEDYQVKRNLMMDKIKAYFPAEAEVAVADGGLFLWVTLPVACDTTKLLASAVQNKVAYVPGTPFYPLGGGHNTLRLNFSNATHEQIDLGMRRLGESIAQYINQGL